jgi:hypothetical protein
MVFLKYAVIVLSLVTVEYSFAGLISKAVLIGIDSRTVLAPAARVATQQPNQSNSTKDPNIDLTIKLDNIPQNLGKQGFSLVSTIFLYGTLGQTQLSASQYELAKQKFTAQYSNEDKVLLKIPLELNIVCTQLANDAASDVLAALTKNKKLGADYQYFKELRNCTAFLKRIKGYDLKQPNSYSELADKLEDIYKNKPQQFSNQSQSATNFILATLRNGQHTVRVAREEAVKWSL